MIRANLCGNHQATQVWPGARALRRVPPDRIARAACTHGDAVTASPCCVSGGGVA
jgi:hypothetical protein